ncbi:hypothetical protein BU26DRAFT_151278 [Trematosphaeria pertusa]|uniref:Uncharacterized protein n=1 Tax=Trematosphaeria pertusa TaxID=390896 RepID=A0A6A6IXV7_9PLEO|nr:uncharacterized protein BU26DRAFT_151278 [Trematosphaeria pertusa]KAF2255138.1 hypothetical protein BU26DRAFT_151278 [Trematosphaeria pertusa]
MKAALCAVPSICPAALGKIDSPKTSTLSLRLRTLWKEDAGPVKLSPGTRCVPERIYRLIIENVDEPTGAACLSGARAFRSFASKVYHTTDNVRVGELGPSHFGKARKPCTTLVWYPVIKFSNGTASLMPKLSPFYSNAAMRRTSNAV